MFLVGRNIFGFIYRKIKAGESGKIMFYDEHTRRRLSLYCKTKADTAHQSRYEKEILSSVSFQKRSL